MPPASGRGQLNPIMKTMILGWGNLQGVGPATVVSGTDVPRATQWQQFISIKTRNEFPEGLVRVEFVELEARQTAIHTETAAKAAAEDQAAQSKRAAEITARIEKERKAVLAAAPAIHAKRIEEARQRAKDEEARAKAIRKKNPDHNP